MAHSKNDLDNPLVEEKEATIESDPLLESDEADPEWAESEGIEKETDTGPTEPAELAAVHTDTEAAKEASGVVAGDDSTQSARKTAQPKSRAAKSASKKESSSARTTQVRKQPRSAKYAAVAARVNKLKAYQPKEALALAKETSYAQFDAAVEIHVKLLEKKGKAAETDRLRTLLVLPHGTGREPNIGILDDALIEKIKQAGDTDFDILLSQPSLMPKVAQIAKILGPKGKMPNPKTGTVTDDPAAAKAAIVSGRTEVRADAQNNLHQAIGRVSWSVDKLLENYEALIGALPANRIQHVSVSATMGPSLTIDHA